MKKNNLIKKLQPVFLLAASAAAVCRALAVALSYGTADNYFKQGDLLSVFAVILAVCAAGCGCAAILLDSPKKDKPSIFERASFPNPFAGGAIAAALLFAGYRLLGVGYGSKLSTFDLVLILCLLLATAYGTVSGMQNAANRQTVGAFFGLFAILSCILLNAYYYFDTSIEMNAPLKTSIQVGLLFAMLFLTGEVRYLLGIPMPRMMQLFAVCTVSFGALSAIAVPVAFFSGKLSRPDYLAGALLVLGAIPTAIIRLRTLTNPTKIASGEADTEMTE